MYLILFDIDGTLVLTGRAGMRAMNLACRDIVQTDDAMRGVNFAGRTDWSIFDDVMRKYGRTLDAPLLDELRRSYVRHLADEIQHRGEGVKDVMPGIPELLGTLAGRDDVALALLTGNFIESARIKLEHFDLWSPFSFGAFADDAIDRNLLVPVAFARAREHGHDPRHERVIVIGDTPLDVECARAGGVRALGVATGSHSVDELREAGAYEAFEDLRETPAVMQALGLG